MLSDCCSANLIDESDTCSKCGEHCGILLDCKRCGYLWKPRKAIPKACPSCKRYDWQTDKAYMPGWILHPEVFEEIGSCGICHKTKKLKVVEDEITKAEMHICKECIMNL